MENKNSSQTIILAAAGFLLVAFVAIITYLVPRVSEIKTLNDSIANKQQELALGRQKVQAIRDAIQVINKAKREIEILGIAIPDKEKAEESLVQITTIASANEITISNMSFSSGSDKKASKLTVNVTAQGDYGKFASFFNALNTNLRPVAVSGINFSNNDSTNQLEAGFDLVFPYLSEDSVASTSQADNGGTNE